MEFYTAGATVTWSTEAQTHHRRFSAYQLTIYREV